MPATTFEAPTPSGRASAPTKRVTLKDVAARAGVAHTAVSVVLNGANGGNTGVAALTRERILLAAEELGYQRNGSATAMRSGRFGCVSLLLSTHEFRSQLPQKMWEGIHDALAEHDLHLNVAKLPDEKLTSEGVVPKMLREQMSDGLLIDYTDHIPARMVELIRGHRLPAVWLNSQQEGDCVFPDDYDAGRRAARHLLELGHTRIAYVDYTHVLDDLEEHYSARDRKRGFDDALREAALEPLFLGDGRVPHTNRFDDLQRHLQDPARPSALVCYGNECEMAVIVAASLGLSVPRDLSIVTFTTSGATLGGQNLTKLLVPEYEVGQQAARMLFRKMEQPADVLAPQSVPFGFESGQTCAPRLVSSK